MKKLLLIFVLLLLLINQTTLAYTLTKVDTKIANNKLNILNERIKKGFSYEIIYKQQLLLQKNIKKIRDTKNIKSIAYKNLDKNYTISQYILENLINYGAVKQNIISNLPVKIQDTITQEQTIIRKQNCDDGWYYNEGTMGCQPNNSIRSCNITNGTGKQTWNGNNWENCTVISCNSGYSNSNGSCLVNQPTCSSNQHMENNSCISNIKFCTASNGIGQQSWNGNNWLSCEISSCSTGYSLVNGSCIISEPIASKYPGCDHDNIELSNGQIWSACNIGASVSSTEYTIKTRGYYFQWGNNADNTSTLLGVDEQNGNIFSSENPFYREIFIKNWGYSNNFNHNLWGDSIDSDASRKGPCSSGYHIPSSLEWCDAISSISPETTCRSQINNTNVLALIINTLRLPASGMRAWSVGYPEYQTYFAYPGYQTYYWTSSPVKTIKLVLNSTSNYLENLDPGYGLPIRCIKNK